MENIIERVPNLWNYFNSGGKHLKVLATIADSAGEIQWAIFFSAKGAKPAPAGDKEFKGTVTGNLTKKLIWENEHPLYLIPISESAKLDTLRTLLPSNVPAVKCSKLILCNNKNNNKDFKDYNFWIDSDLEKNNISNLYLSPDSKLERLSPKGEWLSLQAEGDNESWPVWITTQKFFTGNRLIVFSAPKCQIITEIGEYADHEIWFGVRKELNEFRPFISINSTAKEDNDGGDCPIVWRSKRRINDVVKPANLTDQIKQFSIDSWTKDSPLYAQDKIKNKERRVSRIINEFSGNFSSILKQWFLLETVTNGLINNFNFYPIYIRHYQVDDTSGQLFRLIGRGNSPDDFQNVRILQICHNDVDKIFIKIRFIGDKEIRELWNLKANKLVNGLQITSASSPIALVPQINEFLSNSLHYVAVWESTSNRACSNEASNFTLDSSAFVQNQVIVNPKPTRVSLPLLKYETFSPIGQATIGIELNEALFDLEDTTDYVNDNGTLFQFVLKSYALKNVGVIRDGAMSFKVFKDAKDSSYLSPKKYGRFRLSLQLVKAQKPLFLWQWHRGIDLVDKIDFFHSVEDFSLPIETAEAAGQDIATKDKLLAPQSIGAVTEGLGERLEPPLVIPLSHPTSSEELNYLLTFSESTNVSQNHRIDIRLQEFKPQTVALEATRLKAVVLDANPNLVALVDANFLQRPGYDDGAWVVARRSPLSEEAGGWELLDDSASTSGYHIVLPAQAIGEAVVKGNALPGEPKEDGPIDYRFGAPAILRVAPERLERRYVAVPWNLRRIWGQPDDAAPGMPLLEAQFEYLYGLTGNLKPEKATVAELASKLGEIPVPPVNSIAWLPTEVQEARFQLAWQQYLKIYRAWQSRLAILEPSAGDDFTMATFNKNIAFNARILLEKNGSEFKKIAGAQLKLPIPANVLDRNGNAGDDDPDEVLKAKMRAAHDEMTGLAGGFNYGFESTSVYKELWREIFAKGSSSGEVKKMAFSSMGGWGNQTTRFAEDKIVIKSTTSMGRTHFYSVERIGRIGVFWNKAKHVIEYERTVVPSEQFKKSQLPLLGRPLLRKVREYIEILEPIRRYPDFPGDTVDAPGAVLSATFKSIIIPVLSSWGHDVWGDTKGESNKLKGIIGWEVPLWKAGANPTVYPKPQVLLTLLAPPDSGAESVPVNISEPENLWFYTHTQEFAFDSNQIRTKATADVHAWPAILNVDFTDLPEPEQYDSSPAVGNSPELLQLSMPNVLDILPGFERFTFRVDGTDVPSSVTGRYFTDSPISGQMRTVSMSRGYFKKNDQWWTPGGATDTPLKTARLSLKGLVNGNDSLLAKVAEGFCELEGEVHEKPIGTVGLLDYQNQVIEKLSNRLPELKALRDAAKKVSDQPLPTLQIPEFQNLWLRKNEFSLPVQLLWRESLEAAEALVGQVNSYYKVQHDALSKELKILFLSATDKKTKVKALIEQFRQEIELLHIEAGFTIDAAVSGLQKLLEVLIDDAKAAVDQLFSQLTNFLETIEVTNPIDKIKSDVKEQIENLASGLHSFMAILVNKLEFEGVPDWKEKTDQIKNKITERIDKLKADLLDFSDHASQNVNEYINTFRREVYQQFVVYKNQLNENLDELSRNAGLLVAEAESFLVNLHDVAGAVKAGLEQLLDKLIILIDTIELDKLESEINRNLNEIENSFRSKLIESIVLVLSREEEPGVVNSIFDILKIVDRIFNSIAQKIVFSLLDLFGKQDVDLTSWLESLVAYKRLEEAINSRNKEAILQASTAFANSINKEFGRLTGEVAQKAREFDTVIASGESLVQVGKRTLNNYRSVWEEFTAPGMGFNRKTIAMLVKTDYKDIAQRLSLTPSIARVKQFGKDLEGLGLRLPVVAITDQLLPALRGWEGVGKSLINQFDFSNLLSDIGGMRLDTLFPGFRMPESARDTIKVTQGFDKQNLTAWVNATVDIRFEETKELMTIGPFKVQLADGRCTGETRLQVDSEGKLQKTTSGQLSGSWIMSIDDKPLMTFKEAKVIFKNDKLTFNLDPARMEMAGLLKILTDATKNLSATGAVSNTDANGNAIEVFKVGLLKVGEVPAGVLATLNIPPISIGGGTTAITNLSFGGFFMLSVLNEQLTFRFLLGVGFYLGKKESPFNITVFILGGGGYVDCAFYYEPKRGLTVNFAISIQASAALSISLGWIKGSVAIMLGIEIRYQKQPQQGPTSFNSIFVYIIGQVDIMSIASVYLSLRLEITYRSGGGRNSLIGKGQVRLRIRICRFIKINVNKEYTKEFSGSSENRLMIAGTSPIIKQKAEKYVSTLS